MEDKKERQRRLARQRKQRQREREKAHKKAVGAHEFRFEMYRGTAEALERLATAGGFEEKAEVITLLIHAADELRERDTSQFTKLLSVKCHAKKSPLNGG
ncbi:MAG: hypothetical protein ACPGPF_01740 [Pontibacterium sp.]